MKIFKSFINLFTPTPPDNSYWITVRCNRCGEVIPARINLANDLSIEYGEAESTSTYLCRKVLVGSKRCYQPIEIELTFDRKRNLISRTINGGVFTEEE